MQKQCEYCPWLVDTDYMQGWGWFRNEDDIKVFFHTECMQMENGVAI